jgi:hypothetical protein
LGAIFKKKSIFFEYLPYWKEFDVRHAIDGMQVQKNVFESIIGTLLNIKGKTKEGLNSRVDLVNLGIKKELHPVLQENGKYHLPAASYNLNVDEKHAMCVCLKNLRVPSGFCSSILSGTIIRGTLKTPNSQLVTPISIKLQRPDGYD